MLYLPRRIILCGGGVFLISADAAFVEGCLVAASVGEVFLIGGGEVVASGEVLFRAHVDVVGGLRVEDLVDCGYAGSAYRTGRKSGVEIRVVR